MRKAQVRIDGRTVSGPIDLEVGRGERWVLLGPNGGGKTTLLALAGARRQPSAGRVAVLGVTLGTADVRALHPRISHTSHVLAERMPPDLVGPDRGAHRQAGDPLALVPGVRRCRRAPRGDAARAGGLRTPRRAALRHRQPGRAATRAPRPRALLRPGAADPRRTRLGIGPARAGGVDRGARGVAVAHRPAPTTIVATHHLEEIPPSTTHAALLRDGLLVASGDDRGRPHRTDLLEDCFGIAMEVGRRGARWWATAGPPPARPPGT